MKNKRGDVFQLLFLLVILFFVAILGLLFFTMSDKFSQAWQDSGMLNDTAVGQTAVDTMQENAPRTIDYMIFFLFMGSIIGLLISASRTGYTPTVFFLFIILLVITIFVASGLVNVYSGFADSSALVEYSEQLTLTSFIFSKYTPLIMTILGGLIMVIMWGKSGGDIPI
jgi:hypothetical protein